MIAHAWQILVVALAGRLNRQQQDVVECITEQHGTIEVPARSGAVRGQTPWSITAGPADESAVRWEKPQETPDKTPHWLRVK